ncbi:MAG: hypothetical protein PWP57_1053 [Candidatus Atribacteria bacterium]|nr:hypothetical protein [Candidatus Atribacteria bacterium]
MAGKTAVATESKIKVVIDANVFIFAFVFGGNALEIIRLFLKSNIEVYPQVKASMIESKDDD